MDAKRLFAREMRESGFASRENAPESVEPFSPFTISLRKIIYRYAFSALFSVFRGQFLSRSRVRR